jgi:hypothetical protein
MTSIRKGRAALLAAATVGLCAAGSMSTAQVSGSYQLSGSGVQASVGKMASESFGLELVGSTGEAVEGGQSESFQLAPGPLPGSPVTGVRIFADGFEPR